jgi:hypothetical protein
MARRPSNPLSEQAQLLQEQYEQTLRELADAEKALRRKPKAAAPAKPAPERKVRLNNMPAAISLPRPQEHTFRGGASRAPRRNTRRRKTDARLAQVKFLLLCLLLAGLVIFVWKHLPG